MTDKKDVKAPEAKRQRVLVARGEMDAKRALAIRLIEGNGVPQNHPKAVALLEDCVTLGDTDAMLMLAKCCAFGRGMEKDAERAESLISEAAEKRNREALCLMKLINDWKVTDEVDLSSLSCSQRKKLPRQFILMFYTEPIEGKLTIESVCLLMNIVPCQVIKLKGEVVSHTIVHD